MALVVVYTSNAQDDSGDVPMLLPDELLRFDLRARIVPWLVFEWRKLGEQLALFRRLHYEDCAGEDELFDLKIFQPFEQTERSVDCQSVVHFARLAGEIIVSRQMNHA